MKALLPRQNRKKLADSLPPGYFRTFAYEAVDQSGIETMGHVHAATKEGALAKLRGMGYFPTRIRDRGAKEMAKAVRRERQRQDGVDKIVKWCHGHVYTLLLAGLVVLGMVLILA